MTSDINPPIRPEHWCRLPFPFSEMKDGRLEIVFTDTNQTFRALLCIDRHPSDENLFSPVIAISDLVSGGLVLDALIRIRLSPSGVKLIVAHPSSASGFHYHLSMPASALGRLRFLSQFPG